MGSNCTGEASVAPTSIGRRVRAALATAVALAVFAIFSVTGLEPAGAVGCYGDYCSGKDPSAMGCDADARTVAHVSIPGTQAKVELRWSPTCKTNWARVPASWGNSYPNRFSAVQSTGYTQAGRSSSNGTFAWTRMIYSPVKCVSARWTGAPGSASTACA